MDERYEIEIRKVLERIAVATETIAKALNPEFRTAADRRSAARGEQHLAAVQADSARKDALTFNPEKEQAIDD